RRERVHAVRDAGRVRDARRGGHGDPAAPPGPAGGPGAAPRGRRAGRGAPDGLPLPPGGGLMRRVLARRDARLYMAGQGFSLFGDSSMWLALGIWAKTLTGSSGAAGLVFFAVVAPQLGAPAAGLLVDRVRRRPLLIVTNLATGAVVLALLAVHGRGQLWLIYAVAALYGASYTV